MLLKGNFSTLPCDLYPKIFYLLHDHSKSPDDMQNIRALSKFFKFQAEQYLKKTSIKIEIFCQNTNITLITFYLPKKYSDVHKVKVSPQILDQIEENFQQLFCRITKYGNIDTSLTSESHAEFQDLRGGTWAWDFGDWNSSKYFEVELCYGEHETEFQTCDFDILEWVGDPEPASTHTGTSVSVETMFNYFWHSN